MTINVTLGSVSNLQDTTAAATLINQNSTTIVNAFSSALDTTGDQMQGTLDMNSNQIINLPSPATVNSPVRLVDISSTATPTPSIISGSNVYTGNNSFSGTSSFALISATTVNATTVNATTVNAHSVSASSITVPSLSTTTLNATSLSATTITSTGTSNFNTVSASGVSVTNTTSSSTPTTGALVVTGGVGVGGTVNASALKVSGVPGITSFTGTTTLGSVFSGGTSNNDYTGIDFTNINEGSNIPLGRVAMEATAAGSLMTFGLSGTYANGITIAPLSLKYDGSASVSGALTVGGTLLSNSSIGYNTGNGAGSATTQQTSRATAVTINKPTGAITLFSTAGSANVASFSVGNSVVGANDAIILSQKGGLNTYTLQATGVTSGGFLISFVSPTGGGTTTDAPTINFVVLKGSIN